MVVHIECWCLEHMIFCIVALSRVPGMILDVTYLGVLSQIHSPVVIAVCQDRKHRTCQRSSFSHFQAPSFYFADVIGLLFLILPFLPLLLPPVTVSFVFVSSVYLLSSFCVIRQNLCSLSNFDSSLFSCFA